MISDTWAPLNCMPMDSSGAAFENAFFAAKMRFSLGGEQLAAQHVDLGLQGRGVHVVGPRTTPCCRATRAVSCAAMHYRLIQVESCVLFFCLYRDCLYCSTELLEVIQILHSQNHPHENP